VHGREINYITSNVQPKLSSIPTLETVTALMQDSVLQAGETKTTNAMFFQTARMSGNDKGR
jgi:hypothetical protein